MSMMAVRLEVVVVPCPCVQPCRGRSPLDESAERLRAEMRHGRDQRSTPFPGVTVRMVAAFCECPQRN